MENNKKTIITNIIRVAHIGSWAFVLSVVGAVVAGFMNYAFSMVIGFVSTEALRQANIGVFEWSKFQSIIVLSIVMLPFMFLGQMLNLTGGMKADKKLKQAMFSKVLKQKARNMSESHSASIMTLLTSDSWSLDDFYFQGINYRVIHPLVGGIAAIITMVVLDYRLAIIAVTLGLLSIWASVVYTDKMQAAFELARIKNEAGVTSASEIISNELMIRQFGVQSKVINSYDKKNQEVEEAMSEAEFIQHKVTRLQSIINMISILVFIAAGYYLSIKGNFDITQIMLLLSLKSVVGYMFLSLGDSWQFFVEVSSAADRIFKFMDAPLEDFRETLPSIELNKDNVLLSIQDLSFRYKETNVLNKINLEFKTGKGSALVGPSGSGKSSIFRMILGLYDDYEGNILINNKDVSEFNLSSIRDLVVSVEQENPLFNRSIYENIALGSKNYDTVSLEDVIGVSKQGGIHDFITSLDKGYDTLVGEGGSSLSGGQKQRIAIARALMSQAPIMIFDEPTAALDGESERQIQSVIENIAKDKVVLVSAHRLSTIKNMEQIIVVKNGTIDESGTHHELINNNGTYAELVSQNGDFKMEMNQELLWDYESIAIFTRVNRKYDRYSKGLSLVLKQKIDALYDDVEKPIHKLNKLLPETMQVLETHDNSSESFNLLATYFLEFYRNHQSFDKEEFARLVINEMVNFDAMDLEEDIFLLIHKSTLSLGLKWYLLWILEQPQAAYDELELITKTITPIIQKHSLHFTKEIETISTQWNQLAQSDSLETFLKDNLGLITIPSTKDFYFSIVANDRIVLSSRKSIIGLQFTMDHFTSRELSQDEVNRGLKLLGDSSKYAILKELGNGEKYGRELAKSLDLSAATISYHIQELLNEGFVSVRTSDQNNRIYYQIRKSKIKNLIDFAITDLEL